MRNLGAGTSVTAAWAEPAQGLLLFRWWPGHLGLAEALALTGQGKDAARPPPRGAGVVAPSPCRPVGPARGPSRPGLVSTLRGTGMGTLLPTSSPPA